MNSPAGPASLSDPFEAFAELVLLNGWAPQSRLDAARKDLIAQGRQGLFNDPRALGRYMVEHGVLNSDQMTDLDAILKQQINFPDYQLTKKLGAGGMGTVFLAKHTESNQTIAIKTIISRLKEDPDFIGRFHRESKVLAGLDHPHIAKVLDSGESGDTCYMTMEYVQGPSLAKLLKDHQVLPERFVLRIIKQVAEGLAYVYQAAQLVHRDIKPENILISRNPTSTEDFPADDEAKLIDFGLVKPVHDDEHLTQTGMTIGTPLYMSPEQIRGESIDCRSDIYGLGATMYHLLTGTTPFIGTSPGAIMSAHLTQPVPDPSQRVPGLHHLTKELVMMAMAKKSDQRFLSFDAFLKAIGRAMEELGEQNINGPKLLRKPLVLKGPMRKPAQIQSITALAEVGLNESSDDLVEATDRIVNKFKMKQDSTERVSNGTNVMINHAIIKAEVPTVRMQARSSQTIKVPTDAVKRSGLKSKAFDEDPTESLGTGIIPWVVLVAAVAALVLWFVL
jgi:serine/threonine protein kinase